MKNFKIPILIIVLIIGIVVGIQIEKVFSSDNLQESIKKFSDVLAYTNKYYVEEVDTHMLVESAIKGMLNELDPHSVYISPEELKFVEESFRGDFEGIGIEFQVVNDTLTVVSPISGGPSEALGIRAADRIVKINGRDCIGITNDQVREKLRGKAGTKVKITVIRHGFENPIEYEITRDKIPLYSVDTGIMLDDVTGFISVARFSETTYDELTNELEELSSKGMKQLILDFRGNPGGYLSQAVKIADLFLDENKKIVYTSGRRKEFEEVFYASEPSEYEQLPLIILINHGSASASEIVAGAVQDWDRGLIAGETSFGKGLVQRQFELPDNSAIRLTVSEYYTPSGRLIQRDYRTKSKDEYYSEVNNEETEGNNMEHHTEEDSSKPVFKTNSGRIVYGGGGITPDFIVKQQELTSYTTSLLSNNIFYRFVLNYLESNGDEIRKKYDDDLVKFNSDFNITDDLLDKLVKFASASDVEFNEMEFKKDSDYIAVRLKAQIARTFWKNDGWYFVTAQSDKVIQKSLTLFQEAKDLADL
ncbi:MAG: S41 family peptidase [Ignavibacteriaceae bacterium]